MEAVYFNYWNKDIFSNNGVKHTSNIEKQAFLAKYKQPTSNTGIETDLTILEAT